MSQRIFKEKNVSKLLSTTVDNVSWAQTY